MRWSFRFRLALTACAWTGAGCAQVEAPPGGPPDNLPPAVVSTRPEADAVLDSYRGAVVFVFDERISERGLEDAVMVSPRTSPVEVRHGRDEVRVSLRRGWEPGQIYQVVLRPAVNDLFGNRLLQPTSLVFSTGPAIPATLSTGAVTDRITGQPVVDIRVEAIRTTDSLVYAVPTDTAGRYRFEKVPEGAYTIRAFEDVNRNRALDPFESQDSATVQIGVGDTTQLALRLLMPDTTPPLASSARAREELIEVEFDDYLDPEQEIDLRQISLTGPAGPVAISGVTVAPPTFVGATPAAGAPAAGGVGQPGPQAPQQRPGQAVPAADPQAPMAPLPSRVLVLELSAASDVEAAGEYVITYTGIRNVNGLAGDGEVTFTVAPIEQPDVAAAFRPAASVATLEPR